MGVDSGLPDFRGDEGFWRAYPALASAKLNFMEVDCPVTFNTDPTLAWGFYGHRLGLYRATKPHAGFALLLQLANKMRCGAFVFTSNVDGHFQAAGFREDQVNECHGSIHWMQCSIPCTTEIWSAMPALVVQDCRCRSPLPRCPNCGAVAGPNILMFNDTRWISERNRGQQKLMNRWLRQAHRPVVIELGAGVHVPTVRHMSELLVNSRNAHLLRVNPRDVETPLARGIGVPLGALESLQALCEIALG